MAQGLFRPNSGIDAVIMGTPSKVVLAVSILIRRTNTPSTCSECKTTILFDFSFFYIQHRASSSPDLILQISDVPKLGKHRHVITRGVIQVCLLFVPEAASDNRLSTVSPTLSTPVSTHTSTTARILPDSHHLTKE